MSQTTATPLNFDAYVILVRVHAGRRLAPPGRRSPVNGGRNAAGLRRERHVAARPSRSSGPS